MNTDAGRHFCPLVSALALVAVAPMALAAKPTKPGGGSGSDGCADPAIDFPAFIYWQQNSTSREIFVADADGKCSRSVTIMPYGAGGASFSYPVDGTANVGRVAWPDPATDSIGWLDFSVNDADRTISVGQMQSTPLGRDTSAIELSKDGNTAYFSISPGDVNQSGSIWRISLVDTDPNAESLYTGPNALVHFTFSVSADESILVIEESDFSAPEGHRLVRVCLKGEACQFTLAEGMRHQGYPAVSADGSTVAYSDYQDGSDNCWLLTYLDSEGARLFSGTQPRYGRNATWLGNEVLAEGRKPPDRRYKCAATDSIVKINPATGSEVTLLRGFAPDAR